MAALMAGDLIAKVVVTSDATISALLPRDKSGHHFVFFSDCTSGRPGQPQADNLQILNAMIRRIKPQPEFIVFPGDAVMGYTKDYQELRRQWDYWYDTEMSWLRARKLQLYQSTSNHNTYDAGSEDVFRKVHHELPQNGPPGQEGLAYFVRKGNLLIVSTHQPHWNPSINYAWLDQVLTDNADAKYKFVTGHYPVFPVNGYEANPQWCFAPELRKPFWDVMLKHRVDAYLASHIIAFDVQVHEGLLQIVSAGAGSVFGPDGFMRGEDEYLHAIQMVVDGQGLQYQVHDHSGRIREQLTWPLMLPEPGQWHTLNDDTAKKTMANIHWKDEMVAFRVRGDFRNSQRGGVDKTIISSSHNVIGMPGGEIEPLWIGIDSDSNRLTVRIVPIPGGSWQDWKGPLLVEGKAFDFQIVLHSGMGPGGILLRGSKESDWSTLESHSNKGIEGFRPPSSWTVGHGQSGDSDRPFGGSLIVETSRQAISTPT